MPIKTQYDDQPTLNLTPMIDVVFLLIIFFMVATKFSELEQNIELEVPEVASAGANRTPATPRTVAVYEDGHIELDGQQATLQELRSRLAANRAQDPDLNVVVRGDGQCDFQHIASAMAACRDAGVAELGITVRVGDSKGQRNTIR
ncbi:MAG: biopolymer transporter ExbD [Pirellulales bacterium]|nr:biopolymer transporter ExbD [Pirellulales bacterium]